jgi:hypothetical protein
MSIGGSSSPPPPPSGVGAAASGSYQNALSIVEKFARLSAGQGTLATGPQGVALGPALAPTIGKRLLGE